MSYKEWTIVVEGAIELRLLIDGKDIIESIPIEKRDHIQHITEIKPVMEDSKVQISIGKFKVNMAKDKFRKTTLFMKEINDTDDLFSFWKDVSGFLDNTKSQMSEPESSNVQEEETEADSVKMYIMDEAQETDISTLYVNDEEVEVDNHSTGRGRKQLMESISKKKIDFRYVDIFTLHDPPPKYRVRETNEEFVDKLADVMIEKKSVSVHNAPSVIGLIDIEKTHYKEENLSLYQVYILDGNHSIKAQKVAYNRTKDPLYKYRGVNIYCGLTEDEALLLGISRNEDTGQFVKFTDVQKVEVLRRRLYTMTNTSENEEPPEPPKAFKDVFSSLLNLQTKKEIDSKCCIRYLATNLSNRCFTLYKDICNRGNFPASKFDALKGLAEEDSFDNLELLSSSNLDRNDWQLFSRSCQEKQKKPRKLRKDVIVTFKFNNNSTEALIGHKPMNGNVTCYRFQRDDSEIIMSDSDFRRHIFEFNMQGDNRAMSLEEVLKIRHSCWSPDIRVNKHDKHFSHVKHSEASNEEENNPSKAYSSSSDTRTHKSVSSVQHAELSYDEENSSMKGIGTTITLSPSKLKPNVVKRKIVCIDAKQDITTKDSSEDEDLPIENISCASNQCMTSKKAVSVSDVSCASNQCMTSKNAVSDSDVSLFLHRMADEAAVIRAENRLCLIEEDEVETIPANLHEYTSVLLKPDIKAVAKKYFTEDAWQCVESTLTILEAQYVKSVQKKLDSECCIGKGKAVLGSNSGRIFLSGRQDAKEKVKTYVNKFIKDCASTPKKQQQTGRRDVYSFGSDELSPIKSFKGSGVAEMCIQSIGEEGQHVDSQERGFCLNTESIAPAGKKKSSKSNAKRKHEDQHDVKNLNVPCPKKKCRVRLTDISTVKDLKNYVFKSKE